MKIYISTPISNDYKKVFSLFNLELFTKLKPPMVSLVVERFDGCKKGDEVHLRVSGNKWVSHIVDYHQDDEEIYFIDVGVITPLPIKSWRHVHKIKKTADNQCLVIDDIEYSTGNKFLDGIIYPGLYFMFSLRRPVYRRELS